MIPGMKQLSYEKRLQKIGLWSLEERRNRADLLEVFRMFKGWSTASFNSLFSLMDNSRTRGHSAKIAKSLCRLELRRYFFSQQVTDRWNRLDQSIIESQTINTFKSGLNTRRVRSRFLSCISRPPNQKKTTEKVKFGERSFLWHFSIACLHCKNRRVQKQFLFNTY